MGKCNALNHFCKKVFFEQPQYRGVGPAKKEEKFPLLKNSQQRGDRGGGGLMRLGWFPTFYRFLNMKVSLISLAKKYMAF